MRRSEKEKPMKHNRAMSALVLLVIGLCPSLAFGQHYVQTDLVSDIGAAPVVPDANVRNAWGLVHGAATPWWISNNASGTSTLVNASAIPVTIPSLVVGIPDPSGKILMGGHPTAVLFNGSATDFILDRTTTPPKQAIFIWATEDGTIAAWNPGVQATEAVIKADNSQKPTKGQGAVYKGATIAEIHGQKYILAANFRSGEIDVFDTNFMQQNLSKHAFRDQKLPKGFAPFNIQGIGPNVYVTYAKQDDDKMDDVPGAGLGFVDVFSPSGDLLMRLDHGDFLNAPWGVTLAPAFFGEFSHAVLVGNFGDGTINAFNPVTGEFLGKMLTPSGSTLAITGLWGLAFGNGGASGPGNTLFFTAGPNDEMDGLFGSLTPIATELNDDDEQ
jgi:uncharacterized protein (TIGR03118 family)